MVLEMRWDMHQALKEGAVWIDRPEGGGGSEELEQSYRQELII